MNSFRPPNVRLALPGFAPGVRDAIYSHVYADPANEVGGLLAGDRRPDGVMVVGAVRADGASGDVTSLTFTHESWTSMLAELDAQYPGAEIVGWYHSHPGHGIFLSRHDEFIHRHFFPAAWQFAIVVDPHHHDEGLFMWRGGDLPRVAGAPVDPRWAATTTAHQPAAPKPAAPKAQVPEAKAPRAMPERLGPSATPERKRRPATRTADQRTLDREARARRRAEFANERAAGAGRTGAATAWAVAAVRAGAVIALGFAIGAVVIVLT